MYCTNGDWGHGTCYGGGTFTASAYRGDFNRLGGHRERRHLDLTPHLDAQGLDWCRRTARRWAKANGFIRIYRPKASHRRFTARMRPRLEA